MPQTTDQLKPCPFCGSQAELVDRQAGPLLRGAYVICDCCKASQGITVTAQESRAAWNRRAVPLVAEAPMEPVACEHLRCTWAGPGTPLVCDSCHVTLGYKIASVPPASLAPMPEPTDEQIHALWVKHVGTHTSNIAFARALLASVAPQPEQPNTDSVHLAANRESAVHGLDAAAPSYYCNKCGSFPDAVQHKRPDGTDCPYIARTAHGVMASDALDARRYRFLRDVAHPDSNGGLRCVGNCADGGAPLHISGRDLDRAVDAAAGVKGPDHG